MAGGRRAKSYYADDLVVCVLRGGFSRVPPSGSAVALEVRFDAAVVGVGKRLLDDPMPEPQSPALADMWRGRETVPVDMDSGYARSGRRVARRATYV
jgi:hypothetical protein